MTPNHHELKIDPQPFADLLSGAKTCEVRNDDRGFQVGDTLTLHEREDAGFTGRTLARRITHIQRGYGLPEGICVLSYEQDQSAPEPVQGEAVEVVAVVLAKVFGRVFEAVSADSAYLHCSEGDQLMTVAQHNRIMAAAKPDTELVASIREKFPRIDPCSPVPLDEKAHCCEYTIYVERERLHRLIDAKLAELQSCYPAE